MALNVAEERNNDIIKCIKKASSMSSLASMRVICRLGCYWVHSKKHKLKYTNTNSCAHDLSDNPKFVFVFV